MPKVLIDPVKQSEQFKADLAAMAVGRSDSGPAAMQQQRILDKSFGLIQFKFNRWSAELSEAQTLDDALRPVFWANIAEKIMGFDKGKPKGRGDIIEVRKLDTGMYAELLITEIGPGFVKVEKIAKYEPVAPVLPDDVPFQTRWNAGAKSHEVIRRADKVLMKGGFQSKDAAVAWIADHLKAMAA